MKSHIFRCLILISFIFLVCNTNTDPLVSELPLFAYPTKIGNQWEYHRVITLFNFRPDSITNSNLYPDTIDLHITVKIESKQTLDNSIVTYKFLESGDSLSRYGESYYSNTMDGMYLYAYESPGTMFPKLGFTNKLRYKENSFGNIWSLRQFLLYPVISVSIPIDSLNYEDPPLLVIKYPYKIGEQWPYRTNSELFRIDKKILEKDTVAVPLGNYDCYKIQYLYDFDLDNQWDDGIEIYDYIGQEGLLKRSILINNIQVIDENLQVTGLIDYKEESEITGITLN